MDNLTPTNRGEQYLDNILRTLNDENVEVELVAGNDDEKFLDDILKAAGGNEPLYNLTERWRHQWWLRKIAEAIASGGGGGCELLATKEFEVSTTSTTETVVGIVELGDKLNMATKNDIIITRIHDKGGIRNGYFYETIQFFFDDTLGNDGFANVSPIGVRYYVQNNSLVKNTTVKSVYVRTLTKDAPAASKATVCSKYSNNSSETIDGTYVVDMYKLTHPFTLYDEVTP